MNSEEITLVNYDVDQECLGSDNEDNNSETGVSLSDDKHVKDEMGE